MALTCCPLPDALETIPVVDCPENFGQIQRIFVQRLKDDTGALNTINVASILDGPLGITELGAWTALAAATDSTKVVVSPIIAAVQNTPGEPREFGSGNQVPGGVPFVVGSNPSAFTAQIYRARQDVIAAMKKLGCENELGIWLVNENGQIGCIGTTGPLAGVYSPIPVQQFFVGDKRFGGFDEVDSNEIRWSFLANATDNFAVVTPTFNALTDI